MLQKIGFKFGFGAWSRPSSKLDFAHFFRIDLHSMIFNSRTGRVLMGGMQNKLVELDLRSGKEVRVRRRKTNRSLLRNKCC
jgi:hypothetical protein